MNEVVITPLGGVGEVGRSSVLFEHGNNILMADCGIMPRSPEERKNINLEEGGDLTWRAPHFPMLEILDKKMKEGKKVAAFITHAHLDHIGALSELIKRGIPIYVCNWTRNFFVTRYLDSLISEEELGMAKFVYLPDGESEFRFEDFSVKCFPVEHSIPNALGVLIKVGGKNIVHLTDFKFNGLYESRAVSENRLLQIKKDCGEIDCLVLDVLNAEIEGFTPPEIEVIQSVEEIIQEANDRRVFLTFFSSNIQRLGEILKVCKRLHRPVRVLGRGMKISRDDFVESNSHVLRQVGKPWRRPFGNQKEVFIFGGCQGEKGSHLWRIINGGWTNPQGKFIKSDIRIKPRDVVAFLSRCIPGNEGPVRESIEGLYRRGAKVILQEGESQKLQQSSLKVKERVIHFSGHGYQRDILEPVEILNPKTIIPVHAEVEKVEIFANLLGSDSKKLARPPIGETLKI